MTIKIASRSSKLALAQVDAFVTQFSISDYEIIKIKTEGDKKSAQGETLFDKFECWKHVYHFYVSDQLGPSLMSEKS